MTTTVNMIGSGAIGRPVATWLGANSGFALQDILRRDTTAWRPAELSIDTAGPDALRQYGPRLLRQGELWSVGAVALADDAFREEMAAIAAATGHRLRLFTGWIGGIGLHPVSQAASLHVEQSAPGLGERPGIVFDGPLREALQRFPHHLNTACAAALCGPGIDNTTVRLSCTEPGAPHVISATLETASDRHVSSVTMLVGQPGIMHPVAAAIIAALERRGKWLGYG